MTLSFLIDNVIFSFYWRDAKGVSLISSLFFESSFQYFFYLI